MNKLNGIFAALDVSASGLSAQRRRLNAVAENLANATTTRTSEGGPYRRKVVRFAEVQERVVRSLGQTSEKTILDLSLTRQHHLEGEPETQDPQRGSGVRAEVSPDTSPPKAVYDPTHPDADENGFVKYPNINVVTEMVEMMSATRAYEANVTAIKAFKEMANKALEIGKA